MINLDIYFPVELQRQIEAAIIDGKLVKGQFVTVDELASVWLVSPDEIQQVLLSEYLKGLVNMHGEDFEIIGTVSPILDSLFQHTSKAGMKPTSDVRAAIVVPCPEIAAAKIDAPTGAPVYRLERTRIVNDEVLANQVNYIPFEVCPGLEHDDISQYSFQKLLEGKYYTVILEIKEVIFNMLTLFFFGRIVEQVITSYIGPIGFVLFYLSAIVVAILPTYLRHRHDPHYSSLGASGGVSAVLFASILLNPWMLIFIPIPVPAFIYAIGYVAYSFWKDRQGGGNVNHSAHLSGAIYGVLFMIAMEPGIIGHFLRSLAEMSFR